MLENNSKALRKPNKEKKAQVLANDKSENGKYKRYTKSRATERTQVYNEHESSIERPETQV